MSAETWAPIPGFDGYEVSTFGQVRSRRKYHGSYGPRILKTCLSADGYPMVHLKANDGRDPVIKVHILVMLAFVGERPEGLDVIRHLDGNGSNNALVNLRYGTSSENSLDQVVHGTHPFARRTHCKHGHEYTPENTAIWTSSKGRPFRMCKECHRAKARQRRRGQERVA